MGHSQNQGYFLGGPIKRTIAFWGLYWGPPILGIYYIINLLEMNVLNNVVISLGNIAIGV